jgi:hypothetical protein
MEQIFHRIVQEGTEYEFPDSPSFQNMGASGVRSLARTEIPDGIVAWAIQPLRRLKER